MCTEYVYVGMSVCAVQVCAHVCEAEPQISCVGEGGGGEGGRLRMGTQLASLLIHCSPAPTNR